MKRLSDKLNGVQEVFIEDILIDAIIFDDSTDVTVWAKTEFAGDLCFLYLALSFTQLDLILRHSGNEGKQLDEIITQKMLEDSERPYIVEFNNENDLTPIRINDIAIKISGTLDALGEETDSSYNIYSVDAIYKKII